MRVFPRFTSVGPWQGAVGRYRLIGGPWLGQSDAPTLFYFYNVRAAEELEGCWEQQREQRLRRKTRRTKYNYVGDIFGDKVFMCLRHPSKRDSRYF